MVEQRQRENTTSKSPYTPKPKAMQASYTLQLLAAAAVIGAAVLHLITVERDASEVGPLTYGIATLSAAALMGVVFLLSALHGTGGSRRGRMGSTGVLALSTGLLLFAPMMVVAVLPSIVALILLWVPESSAFVRAHATSDSAEDGDSAVESLLNSPPSGPRVPWANAMPGNPHQPGV
ncbi:hypothetical protein FEF26_01910 [Nesterenkonia salmonea]|uniref:Uncharacterized protein n=1 Tax=Nesterenkonia salmonea TaxID=1804987 RepID=A0A5R9BJN2_9MICC|nr:hypothetical protein [Nesterenkonia salmonea]TLQ00343.1 hypothetical protein FEF26_01910 [Nesterenkonia salmonea]